MPSFLLPMFGSLISAGTQLLGQKRQERHNRQIAQEQNQMNRDNMQWSFDKNKQLLAEQLAYDTPEAQMARYKQAGLNPHLIYGQGSSGTQGQPLSFGQAPGANIQPTDKSIPDVAKSFIGNTMAMGQIGLNLARENQANMNTQAESMKLEIAKTNPMLKPGVANWVATSMEELAKLKTMESRSWMSTHTDETPSDSSHIQNKVHNEVKALEQRLGLNNVDLSIRNRILESKEFENAIKEIQTKWLKDADITPEHIRQGLMMLLSKMIGR